MKKIISILMVSGLFASITSNVYAGYFITPAREACPQVIETNPSFGNASDEVLFMQNELKREGYFNEIPTGYFDNYTAEALKKFQRDNDLLQSGKVGSYTKDYLNQRICGFSTSSNGTISAVGTTVVGAYDPFVRVINAETDKYVATQNSTQGTGNTLNVLNNNQNTSPVLPSVNSVNPNINTGIVITDSANISYIPPATLINQPLNNANIIYNPQVGYTYSVSPKAGSITMVSPGVNSVFHEGDTVKISWYTTNLNVSAYRIMLENLSTGVSKELLTTTGTEANVILTKEIIDYVCSSSCDQYQQSNFQISITTPVKDMSGNITNLKAKVSSVTIKRDIYTVSNANISSSKSPVDSDELFKLYINISNPNLYNWVNGKYSFGISATCPVSTTVSIIGMSCGQELLVPQMTNYTQKEIPVKVTNVGWFTQPVTFNLSVYDEFGRVTGTSSTTVQVNPVARSW